MTVTPVQVWTAGGSYTLSCSVTYEEFLQITPTLKWTLPGTTDDTTIGDQSNTENMSSISLNFNPLRTSHGGVYVCEATVNISGITLQSQTANETVRVQSKFIIKSYDTAMMIIFFSSSSYYFNQRPLYSLQWNKLHFDW